MSSGLVREVKGSLALVSPRMLSTAHTRSSAQGCSVGPTSGQQMVVAGTGGVAVNCPYTDYVTVKVEGTDLRNVRD